MCIFFETIYTLPLHIFIWMCVLFPSFFVVGFYFNGGFFQMYSKYFNFDSLSLICVCVCFSLN